MLLEHGYTKNQRHRALMLNALKKRQEKEFLLFNSLFNMLRLQFVKDEYKQKIFDNAQQSFVDYINLINGVQNQIKVERKEEENWQLNGTLSLQKAEKNDGRGNDPT